MPASLVTRSAERLRDDQYTHLTKLNMQHIDTKAPIYTRPNVMYELLSAIR